MKDTAVCSGLSTLAILSSMIAFQCSWTKTWDHLYYVTKQWKFWLNAEVNHFFCVKATWFYFTGFSMTYCHACYAMQCSTKTSVAYFMSRETFAHMLFDILVLCYLTLVLHTQMVDMIVIIVETIVIIVDIIVVNVYVFYVNCIVKIIFWEN